METGKRNIAIIGGGIIGCTTAYYLTRHPKFSRDLHTITVLEAAEIAAGASGNAGGLCAQWAFPECLSFSYGLHEELAAEHGGEEHWGYRKVGCGSVGASVSSDRIKALRPSRPEGIAAIAAVAAVAAPVKAEEATDEAPKDWEKLQKQDAAARQSLSPSQVNEAQLPDGLDWIDPSVVTSWSAMTKESAQVHPFRFTTFLANLARAAGVTILTGAHVTSITSTTKSTFSANAPGSNIDSTVLKVSYRDRTTGMEAAVRNLTDVVVAAGPWTGRILPHTMIRGLKAHAVSLSADVSPWVLFTDIALPDDYVPEHREGKGRGERPHRGKVDPEIYARPDGEVYLCGEVDRHRTPLPDTADLVRPDEDQCGDLLAYACTISPEVLARAPVRTMRACYLPEHMRNGKESGPMVGPTAISGVWVASGHYCWGIQNGPGTGKIMSEYLLDGEARSADVSELHPAKFGI